MDVLETISTYTADGDGEADAEDVTDMLVSYEHLTHWF
jgi:hypothetical protein